MVAPYPKANSASDWISNAGVLITFPSGMTARIRPVSVELFARAGRIPDMLTSEVAKSVADGTETLDTLTPEQQADELRKSTEFNDLVTQYAFLEPKIGDKEGEVPIDMILEEDRAFLVREVFGKPLAHLKTFRAEQEGNVESVHRGEGDGQSTE